jgi:glycosyltransferase involved in cell wall biosynthesis
MPPVKVGLDLTVLELPCPTGVERAWRSLAVELANRRGREKFVLYSRGPLDLGVERHRRIQYVDLGGREPLSLWREKRLVKALDQDGIDILHAPFAAMPLRARVPCVVTVHELPWVRHPGCEGRGREMAHRIRVRVAAAKAARIVVPSESTREDLVALHPDCEPRVRVVPHGIDPVFTEPPSSDQDDERLAHFGLSDRRWMVAAGGARPRKDLPGLLDAFACYREAGGDRTLVLTGPGKPPAGPPPGVKWLGYVEDVDLVALLRGADALVYHSLNEGFGLPPLEAMSLGTPVLATDTGSVGATCGDAALLVPAGDAGALAEGMGEVTTDEAVRERLAAAGREWSAGFTMEKAADAVLEAWRELDGEGRTNSAAGASKET